MFRGSRIAAIKNRRLSRIPAFTDPVVPAPAGSVPIVTAVSYGVVDVLGGGQRVVVTVNSSTGCTTIAAGGVAFTSFAIDDATHVSGVPGAHAAGVVDVVVTNATGPSTTGTGLINYWYPGTEASCTLLAERADYAAGTWTARIGGNFTSGGVAPAASGGEPVFNSAGYLVSAANLSAYVGATDGTIFSVQAPTSEDNPEAATPYSNHAIWSKQSSGPLGLWNATDGVNEWYGFSLYDGVGYPVVRATVANLTSGRHAAVATFSASRMRLSVNGSALASASSAVAGSALGIIGANPINLGADYINSNGFSGSMRVFAMFNVEADDALATRCYQWARQRHGIA